MGNRDQRTIGSRPVLVLVALSTLAGLVNCSSPEKKNEAAQAAVRLVRRYVDAIRHDDFAEAMALRCSAARTTNINRSRYLADAERLRSTMGTIVSVNAVVIAKTLAKPLMDLASQIQVSYRLVTTTGEKQPLIVTTGIEHGTRVLCGGSTSEAEGFYAPKEILISATAPTSRIPRDLLAIHPPSGGKLADDRSRSNGANAPPSEVGGWTKAWRLGSYGGARISAVEFISPQTAVDAVGATLKAMQANAVEKIQIPGVPGSAGIRTIMFSTLWNQPGDTPPYIDTGFLVLGNVIVDVSVTNVTEPGHNVLFQLIRQIYARARE